MSQNVYDDPDFFAGYSRLRRQVQGLAGAPEWPAVRAMLPELTGKRVADLGCGFGWASRMMREQGASSVLGIDLSHRMIERARAETSDAAIEYRIADLESLELPEGSFDFVFSSLAFHYVRDFGRLVGVIRDALASGGQLVFTIEHPIYMAPANPRWIVDEDGRRTWPVDGYGLEGERRTDWFVEGVIKHHRTIGTTLNTLLDAGFELQRVEEFAPTPDQVAQFPALGAELDRPMMLLVAARAR